MRHNMHRASLGVTKKHRSAMLSNMAASLIEHGKIQTTLTKAKALRPFIERVITKAKKASVATEKKDAIHLRRMAMKDVRNESIITLLFNEKVKEFANRPGGYTRIYKLGTMGRNDAAEMAQIELIKGDDTGYAKRRKPAAKAAAPAPAAASAADAPAA